MLSQSSSTHSFLREYFRDENADPHRSSVPRQVVFPSVVESMILLSFALITEPFVESDTPWYDHPIILATTIMAINSMLRLVQYYLPMRSVEENFPILTIGRMNQIFAYLRAALFSIMDSRSRSTLVHEAGHALAAISLFKHANPTIVITKSGGNTPFSSKMGPTAFGTWLGETKSDMLVYASGTLTSMGSNYLGLIAAQAIPDEYMELKTYIRVSILITVLDDLMYSLDSYISKCKPGYDFCELENDGIPPILCTFAMIVSYMLVQLSLSAITRYRNHARNEDVAAQPLVSEMSDRDVEAGRSSPRP